jgi:general secretion pathway protein D
VYLALDFTDVDLPVLIKFMSEQTRRNFIFDERVQGKVTIVSPRKMTEEEAYNVFLSVLQVKGFATVPIGNSIKIVPAREVRQDTIPTSGRGTGAAHAGEFVTRLVPLRHAESQEVVQLLTPLLSKDGMISSFPASNTILLIDSRANIDRLLGILRTSCGKPRRPQVLQATTPRRRTSPLTLEQLFQPRRSGRRAGARGSASSPPVAVGRQVHTGPRTNNLIVIAPRTLQEVRISSRAHVGIPPAAGRQRLLLENADAEEVAKVLSSLSAPPKEAARGPDAGRQPRLPGDLRKSSRPSRGGVKVTADKATTPSSFVASPTTTRRWWGHHEARHPETEVFVEAAILEIDLNKSRQSGAEWRVGGK